jgi:hypothetical protein
MITTPCHGPGPSGTAEYADMLPGIGIFASPTTAPPRTRHHVRMRSVRVGPEPVDLEQYCVRRQARTGGLINEYRLVA